MDPDFALLDRWIADDKAAGNELFRKYFTSLYSFFAAKTDVDADDLVQETFAACVKGRDTFQRQSSFRTYLFAIARHTLHGHWRRRKRAAGDVPVEELSIASLSTTLGTRLAGHEERARLVTALSELPMDVQLLLELYYWHEATREQLAEIFDVQPATIGGRLFRAREQLRAMLTSADSISEVEFDAWARSLSRG